MCKNTHTIVYANRKHAVSKMTFIPGIFLNLVFLISAYSLSKYQILEWAYHYWEKSGATDMAVGFPLRIPFWGTCISSPEMKVLHWADRTAHFCNSEGAV